jgi:hypothetical protein
LREAEEMKEMFKPKINNNIILKRDEMMYFTPVRNSNKVNVEEGGISLEKKIEIFKKEASERTVHK